MSGAPDREQRDESAGLYVGWDELHRRVAPKLGRDRFRALIAQKIAREGFPPFREDWRGWYWPKVRRWLDKDNEVETDGVVAGAQDGPENFDAPTRSRPRPQTRSPQTAVLDRAPGGAKHQRLPGQLYSAAAGRR
jgi:hypothetical protein